MPSSSKPGDIGEVGVEKRLKWGEFREVGIKSPTSYMYLIAMYNLERSLIRGVTMRVFQKI